MTAMLPQERVEVVTQCRRGCGSRVIATVSVTDDRPKVLDPTPQPGGQFSLDSKGRAVRRPIRHQTDEMRAEAAVHGGGYNLHTCVRRR